jgi:hypothetical protein
MHNHPILGATVSGGIAGGLQALVAAPAENARLAIEGGTSGHSWTQAWRSMTQAGPETIKRSRATRLREAREFRNWMREVGEMAGRGWNGWGWGCAKDICGGFDKSTYAMFELIFIFQHFLHFSLFLKSPEGLARLPKYTRKILSPSSIGLGHVLFPSVTTPPAS